METQPRFPPELLKEPAKIRLEYFKGVTIWHPLLRETLVKVRNAIHEPAGAALVFAVGPAGVGKTTLLNQLRKELIEELLPTLEENPGRMPVVSVEAVGPDAGKWSWKDFFARLLRALDEPLVEYKRTPDSAFKSPSRASVLDLRYALEQAIRYRQPAGILIDEAQHIAKNASGRKLQDQLDCIKSLANMTNTPHALFGSYELLAFRNLSAQLSRRSIYVPFHRYRYDRESDVVAFKNILKSFELYIPMKEKPSLTEHWEYLYEWSIGCVGVLKDLLYKGFAQALSDKKESIALRDLSLHALSGSQCKTMLTEARHGESELEENEGTRQSLRALLRMDSTQAVPKTSDHVKEYLNKKQALKGLKKRRRVGEPNPKRYPTGVKA